MYGQDDRYHEFVSNYWSVQIERISDGYRRMIQSLYYLQGKDIHSIEANSRLSHVACPSHFVESCHLIGVRISRSSYSKQLKKFPEANVSAPPVTARCRLLKRATCAMGLTISGDPHRATARHKFLVQLSAHLLITLTVENSPRCRP